MIGRKLYYDNITGEVLAATSEMLGDVVPTTLEQDFSRYAALAERTAESVGVKQLEFGEFSVEFNSCKSYSVDVETNTLKFLYYTPEELEGSTEEKPLKVIIAEQAEQIRIMQNTMNFILGL